MWRIYQIVSEPKRDWQGLERKLGLGKPLAQACQETGIPLEEAATKLEIRLRNETGAIGFKLRSVAEGALQTAMSKLTAIVNEAPRERIERLTKATKEAGGDASVKVTLYNTDLDAAKALAKIAIETLKLSGGARPPAKADSGKGGQRDLFDATQSEWDLRELE